MLLSLQHRKTLMTYQLVVGFKPRVENPTSRDPSSPSLLEEALEHIFTYKHHLKHSQYHYNVFIREQLSKERARALYLLKKFCRLHEGMPIGFQKGSIIWYCEL